MAPAPPEPRRWCGRRGGDRARPRPQPPPAAIAAATRGGSRRPGTAVMGGGPTRPARRAEGGPPPRRRRRRARVCRRRRARSGRAWRRPGFCKGGGGGQQRVRPRTWPPRRGVATARGGTPRHAACAGTTVTGRGGRRCRRGPRAAAWAYSGDGRDGCRCGMRRRAASPLGRPAGGSKRRGPLPGRACNDKTAKMATSTQEKPTSWRGMCVSETSLVFGWAGPTVSKCSSGGTVGCIGDVSRHRTGAPRPTRGC